jgi:hypothetical protein
MKKTRISSYPSDISVLGTSSLLFPTNDAFAKQQNRVSAKDG